jgi:transcriptional regulator with XRE-family HTH domain
MDSRLLAMRSERGHTKASLAKLAGVTPGTIADMENGGQAKVQTVEALAKALKISPAWLAFGVGPQILLSRRRPGTQSAAHSG